MNNSILPFTSEKRYIVVSCCFSCSWAIRVEPRKEKSIDGRKDNYLRCGYKEIKTGIIGDHKKSECPISNIPAWCPLPTLSKLNEKE
jgi:hypothetical protein